MPNDLIDGGRMYLVCPNPHCRHTITRESEYKFLNVHSDIHERDVITFVCRKCEQTGESLVFISPN